MELVFQIVFVLLLVLLNGYFVASEFSLVAIRKTRVEELVHKGRRRAKLLQIALHDLDSYISATQLGITIASIALGWMGEPVLAAFFEPLFGFLPHTAAWFTAHTVSAIIAFSIITFLHIVLGELAPKAIALQRSEATALWIITPLLLFARVFRPFIWILNGSGQLVLKLFGVTAPSGHQLVHSEEEIRMILQESSEQGAIPPKEVEMVNNVFQLGDIPVKKIMVPRRAILAFDQKMLLKDVVDTIADDLHSRFPVYKKNIDMIYGFIHVKDVYQAMLGQGETKPLSKLSIIRTIISVSEEQKIDKVLGQMRRKRVHMAVVKDAKGKTSGIVTLEDIIESLVGEIEDEFEFTKR